MYLQTNIFEYKFDKKKKFDKKADANEKMVMFFCEIVFKMVKNLSLRWSKIYRRVNER